MTFKSQNLSGRWKSQNGTHERGGDTIAYDPRDAK